jgi:hypothetical protein
MRWMMRGRRLQKGVSQNTSTHYHQKPEERRSKFLRDYINYYNTEA